MGIYTPLTAGSESAEWNFGGYTHFGLHVLLGYDEITTHFSMVF